MEFRSNNTITKQSNTTSTQRFHLHKLSLYSKILTLEGSFMSKIYSSSYNSNSSLVKCPYSEIERVGKNEITEAKSMAALKNHSEAEKRRRERINGHFATLRGLVPSTQKMDKATLLAEVISQVKQLKKNAMEASKGLLIPKDSNEVQVEPYDEGEGDGSISYKASICCDYTPEILSDLRQTLDALKLRVIRTEISTLGNRIKNVFIFKCCKGYITNTGACQALQNSVHQALSCVVDKASSSLEYLPITSHPTNKKRRLGSIETCTNSCHESCSCS